MNNYVLVDGKKNMTKHKAWMPIIRKPNTSRFLWNGSTDVIYGPGGQREWRGIVIVPVSLNALTGILCFSTADQAQQSWG